MAFQFVFLNLKIYQIDKYNHTHLRFIFSSQVNQSKNIIKCLDYK
jgi:hypothetical protein